jgi:hypothetical protein
MSYPKNQANPNMGCESSISTQKKECDTYQGFIIFIFKMGQKYCDANLEVLELKLDYINFSLKSM